PNPGKRRRERNADTRHRILTRPPHPRLSPERIETKSIDDGCQTTLRSPLNDLLEQHERVIARRDVILTRTDDGTQHVARDDLLRFKMRRRPRALPRTRHAHEDHQTRSREHHLRGRGVIAIHHASSVTPAHPCAEERPTRSALSKFHCSLGWPHAPSAASRNRRAVREFFSMDICPSRSRSPRAARPVARRKSARGGASMMAMGCAAAPRRAWQRPSLTISVYRSPS